MTLLQYLDDIIKENNILFRDGFSSGFYADFTQLAKTKRDKKFDPILYSILEPVLSNDREEFEPINDYEDIRYFDGPELAFLNSTELIVDEGVGNYNTIARRPYFQLRGKRVTEQQAFEIISRTDRFFTWEAHLQHAIDLYHFPNWWFSRNHFPTHYGWCHPSGIIGLNGITATFPTLPELLEDMVTVKFHFPCLDFVVGITGWDETLPDHVEFAQSIELGIWVHENTIEFMTPNRTRKVYEQYAEQYEEPNKEIYEPEYYQERGIWIADNAYLKRCIRESGAEPESVLSAIEGYKYN